MKPLIDSLLLEFSLRPDLGRLLSAALISSGIIFLAQVITRLLHRRSAVSRNILWRMVIAALLLLAFWQLMPRYMPPMTLHIELLASLPQTMPVAVSEPTIQASLPPPAWWEYALSTVDRRAHQIWLSVATMMLCYHLLRSTLGLWHLSKRARPASPELHHICENLLMENGSDQKIICHLVPGLASPLLTGLWKAHIWLPETAMDWSEERLQAVFRHELAHLTRRDLGWQMLTTLAGCLWWWHPLVPAAGRALRAEAEQAADDLAVTSGCDAHGYARTLVEIAAGWAQGSSTTASAGVAMFGSHDNLQHRVRELLKENRWRGQIGVAALVAICIIGFVLLVLASTRLEFRPLAESYTSQAKLVGGGHAVTNVGISLGDKQWEDYCGTIIETLESAEMKKRAHSRIRALYPDLKISNVDIRAEQLKKTALFNVFSTGEEPKFTRVFLDALLDEFLALREQTRERGLERALNTLSETVVVKSKELQDKTEELEAFRKANDTSLLKTNQQEAIAKLKQLQARLAETKQRMADLEIMLSEPDSAILNLERGYTADGSRKLESRRELTATEQSYLKAKAEVFALKQELDYLRQTKPMNADLITAMEARIAKAKHLETTWHEQLDEQCLREKDSLSNQLVKKLNTELGETQKTSLILGAKLAELERREAEFKAAKLTHDLMFTKFKDVFTRDEIKPHFYVAIQERASPANTETKPGVLRIWKLWSKATSVSSSKATIE